MDSAPVSDRPAFGLVEPEHLGVIWDAALPFLARLRERDENSRTADEWRAALESREMQLWIGTVPGRLIVAAITSLERGASGLTCRLRAAAGDDMRVWAAPGMAAIEAWARAQGCNELEIRGRHGWGRTLRPMGFRPAIVISRKAL